MSVDTDDLYVQQHIAEALATDPRTNELEVTVRVSGDAVLLAGMVSSAERREMVERVAREHAGGRHVHNGTEVTPMAPPEEAETL